MATGPIGGYVGGVSDVGAARPHGTAAGPIASGDPSGVEASKPYFGENPKPHMLSPYDTYGRENFSLPEAYLGYSPHMTNVMITLITKELMWPTTVLPYRETKDTSSIVWNEIHFNRHLLGPVPEEGVSRLVSQETNERRDHYARYGLAMILEHGFMNTEKGKMCYVNNLQQIRNAVLETVYIGVLESLLRCKKYDDMWNERYGGARSSAAARKALMMELEDFATIQKTEHGWDLLDSRCKRYLRAKNVAPDTWIIPEGMKPYVTQVRRENYTYMLAGPDGPKNFQSGLNGLHGNAVDQRNDCTIYEVKSFEMPDMAEPIDVTRRNRAIGEFFLMQEDMESVHKTCKYASSQRNIVIYDEDVDNFVEIRLIDAFESDPLMSAGDLYGKMPRRKSVPYARSDSNDQPNYLDTDPPVEFGDVPKDTDYDDLHHCSGPPLSDQTIDLFAESFFGADDKENFSECFGRSAPQYFVDMDESVKRVSAGDNFEELVVSMFQEVRKMCVACDPAEANKCKDDIAKALRGMLAKKGDAYAFWLLCHGIAACPNYFESVDVDGELHAMYKRQIDFANDSAEALLPSPPQMTVQCFQQAVCAVLVTLVRSTVESEGELRLYTVESLSVMERVVGEVCGTWFEHGGDASSGGRPASAMLNTPCVELYDHVIADSDLSSARVGVTVHPVVQQTFDAALFIVRSLFVCMSSSQTIRRGDPCDCKPIGYNTLRGAFKLAEVGDPRFYKSDACDRMLQMYSHMWRGVHHIFGTAGEDYVDGTHGLCQNSEDLFNACVARHGRPGNLHVRGGPVNIVSKSGTPLTRLKSVHDLIDECDFDDVDSYKINMWMYDNYEPTSNRSFFERFVEASREAAAASLGPPDENALLQAVRESLIEGDTMVYDLLTDEEMKYTAKEYLKFIRGPRSVLDIFFANLMLMMHISYNCAMHGMLKRTTADTEGSKKIVDRIRQHIVSNEELTKEFLKRILTDCLHMDSAFKCFVKKVEGVEPEKYIGYTHHGTIAFVTPDTSGPSSVLRPGRQAEHIRTAFKAPVSLLHSDVFFRNSCEENYSIRKHRMTSFLVYLKRYRQNNPSSAAYTCDQVYDDWCRLLRPPGRSREDEEISGVPMRAAAHSIETDDDRTDVYIMVSDRKYDRIANAMDVFESRAHCLLVYIMFCTQPVYKSFLRRLIRNDVMFPFGYLLLRPYQTYEMCTAVLTKAGPDTGETLIGHYDFQLSDNVIQKMHYGNFTIYLRSVVYKPINVYLAYDIMCANYLGGGGSEFKTCDSDTDGMMRTDEDRVPSLYACLIGFDERIKDNPLDVTGAFAAHTCLNNIKTPHYSTARAYGARHAFYSMTPPNGDLPYFDSENRGNTICFQGHQASYNHNSGYIDRVTLNTGHWGERVYPGCGKVRRGLSKFLEPVNYSNARVGGGGVASNGFGGIT
ncbi:hypothetical protein CYMTET_35647 [Cymbomonas tetramitiformis]|uniref:Uncharacterized protein n=1 Tax=Cymbomonas tetramitiformis TaxID=36881 RepID=A0AAE0F8S2_9CHLO|nr:hypothetical protein CYMTET_35647 [Cymbomonas tetramitiformis]